MAWSCQPQREARPTAWICCAGARASKAARHSVAASTHLAAQQFARADEGGFARRAHAISIVAERQRLQRRRELAVRVVRLPATAYQLSVGMTDGVQARARREVAELSFARADQYCQRGWSRSTSGHGGDRGRHLAPVAGPQCGARVPLVRALVEIVGVHEWKNSSARRAGSRRARVRRTMRNGLAARASSLRACSSAGNARPRRRRPRGVPIPAVLERGRSTTRAGCGDQRGDARAAAVRSRRPIAAAARHAGGSDRARNRASAGFAGFECEAGAPLVNTSSRSAASLHQAQSVVAGVGQAARREPDSVASASTPSVRPWRCARRARWQRNSWQRVAAGWYCSRYAVQARRVGEVTQPIAAQRACDGRSPCAARNAAISASSGDRRGRRRRARSGLRQPIRAARPAGRGTAA